MEIKNYENVTIVPATNGVIVYVGGKNEYSMSSVQYVFNNWVELFEFINGHFTNDRDKSNLKKDVNPYSIDGNPIFGGGS